MFKRCVVCEEKAIKGSEYCPNCIAAKTVIQRSAKQMMDLHGVPPAKGICVDCGVRQATQRDHRHYASPLKVEHVCIPCNQKRGAALDLRELIRAHRGLSAPNDYSQDIPQKLKIVKTEDDFIPSDLELYMDNVEKDFLTKAVKKTGGNLTAAAEVLGLTFRTLRYRLEKHNLNKASILPTNGRF